MNCVKCHSPRIIKFIDGFGQSRLFCRSCQESMLVKDVIISMTQKNVWDFKQPTIRERWENAGIGKVGSIINSR